MAVSYSSLLVDQRTNNPVNDTKGLGTHVMLGALLRMQRGLMQTPFSDMTEQNRILL